ncbi:MAG: hypothetical protein E7658_05245 [Ruminococcaceae bacterium]|nr:hypothetical protein [Oscillospiraceae bacterium]
MHSGCGKGNAMTANVKQIVLAGGPASGKSSVIKRLRQRPTEGDVHVLFLDEMATTFLHDRPSEIAAADDPLLLQFYILRAQLFAENALLQNTKYDGQTILISDRGVMDAFVYLNEAELELLKGEHPERFRDRYDHIVYLKGNIDNYLKDNETLRLEKDARTVIETEEKAYRIWSECKSFSCIEQQECIEQKVDLVIEDIHAFLGRRVFTEL